MKLRFKSNVSVKYGVLHPSRHLIVQSQQWKHQCMKSVQKTPVFFYTSKKQMFSDVFLGIEKVWLHFGGFAVNFEQFSYINLGASIVDFEQLPGGWDGIVIFWTELLWLFSRSPRKILKMENFFCRGYFSL